MAVAALVVVGTAAPVVSEFVASVSPTVVVGTPTSSLVRSIFLLQPHRPVSNSGLGSHHTRRQLGKVTVLESARHAAERVSARRWAQQLVANASNKISDYVTPLSSSAFDEPGLLEHSATLVDGVRGVASLWPARAAWPARAVWGSESAEELRSASTIPLTSTLDEFACEFHKLRHVQPAAEVQHQPVQQAELNRSPPVAKARDQPPTVDDVAARTETRWQGYRYVERRSPRSRDATGTRQGRNRDAGMGTQRTTRSPQRTSVDGAHGSRVVVRRNGGVDGTSLWSNCTSARLAGPGMAQGAVRATEVSRQLHRRLLPRRTSAQRSALRAPRAPLARQGGGRWAG